MRLRALAFWLYCRGALFLMLRAIALALRGAPNAAVTDRPTMYGRIHRTTRQIRYWRGSSLHWVLAESISGIRHHDCDAGVHFDLPEDRLAWFRHDHNPLSPKQALPRTQIFKGLLYGVSQSRDLLRECREPDPAGRREGLRASFRKSYRRIQHAGWDAFYYRGGISLPFHSFFKSLTSRSSNMYSQKNE